MRIIKTQQDFGVLRRDGTTPATLVDHIDGYFHQLEGELRDKTEDVFCLDQHGPIVYLEAGDDLRILNFAGLSCNGDELLCRAVEFVEKFDLGEVGDFCFPQAKVPLQIPHRSVVPQKLTEARLRRHLRP
ncbi:hypothetical protein PSAB_02475 [Paenibacillus sabinae T27]|uniref:Uncharacterized protein n=1 Tax=Paenibacillus sabinae T27 TaxID=1268072 RepID=X4Z6P8_9BACL|nr:hypothetical protein PSAB_02475 [Paenibacillus sabinae T27]